MDLFNEQMLPQNDILISLENLKYKVKINQWNTMKENESPPNALIVLVILCQQNVNS